MDVYCAKRRGYAERTAAPRIIPRLPHAYAMEADQLNIIQNSLQDLASRANELRRYL